MKTVKCVILSSAHYGFSSNLLRLRYLLQILVFTLFLFSGWNKFRIKSLHPTRLYCPTSAVGVWTPPVVVSTFKYQHLRDVTLHHEVLQSWLWPPGSAVVALWIFLCRPPCTCFMLWLYSQSTGTCYFTCSKSVFQMKFYFCTSVSHFALVFLHFRPAHALVRWRFWV